MSEIAFDGEVISLIPDRREGFGGNLRRRLAKRQRWSNCPEGLVGQRAAFTVLALNQGSTLGALRLAAIKIFVPAGICD